MAEAVRFGRYTLIKRIAAGGMAEIYLAKQQGPGTFERQLVIKRMLPHLSDDPKFVQMFLDEAALAAQLSHPHIAQVLDFGQEDDSYFIALELIKGPDLRLLNLAAKKVHQHVPTEVAMKMVSQTCQALDYAHRAVGQDGRPLNIVHRDVSPQNILVSYDGVVKLVDFGIAKASSSGSNTEAGVVKGKFAYLSPEQVRTQKLDGRSDLYAASLVLFELLTGEQGLQGDGPAAIANAMDANIAPITNYRTDLPDDLLGVMYQAFSKNRDERQSSCLEFANQLDDLLVQWGVSVGQPEIATYVRELEVSVGEPLSAAARTGSFVAGAELPPPGTGPGRARSQIRPAVADPDPEPPGGMEPTVMPMRRTGTRGSVPADEQQREPVARRSTGLRRPVEPDDPGGGTARPRSGGRPALASAETGDMTLPPRTRTGSRRAVPVPEEPPEEEQVDDEEVEGEEDPEAHEVTPVPETKPKIAARARKATPAPAKRSRAEPTADSGDESEDEDTGRSAPKRKREKEKSGGGGFLGFLLFLALVGGGGYGVWYKTLGPGKPPEPAPVADTLPKPPPKPAPPPANLLGNAAPTGPTGPTGAPKADAVAGEEKRKHHHSEPKADVPPDGQAGLMVDADPPCDVLVDDQVVGQTPFKGGVAPGAHVVKVRNAHLKLERVLSSAALVAGAWAKLSATFQKGQLYFKGIPWADVTFNGKALGTTPLHHEYDPLPVYEGTYDVVFTKDGKTQTKKVTVKGGDTQEITGDFTK